MSDCPSWCNQPADHGGNRYAAHIGQLGTADLVSVALLLMTGMDAPEVCLGYWLGGSAIADQPRVQVWVSLQAALNLATIFGSLGHPELAALITTAARLGMDST